MLRCNYGLDAYIFLLSVFLLDLFYAKNWYENVFTENENVFEKWKYENIFFCMCKHVIDLFS